MNLTTQLEHILAIAACILAALLLISFVRIYLLKRSLNKLDAARLKTESELASQQQEVVTLRQDSQAWRSEIQRQFDAFRSDATRRYGEAELRTQDIQKRLDTAAEKQERSLFEMQTSLDAARRMCTELPSAKARIIELEKILVHPPAAPLPPPTPQGTAMKSMKTEQIESLAAAAKSVSTLPMLPAMDAMPTDEALPQVDEVTHLQQRNTELQRALLLARRRNNKPARPVRRK